MIKKCFSLALALGFLIPAGQVAAHTPLFACFDNADGTIFCEGGFSDGSSAAGVPITVKDASGVVIFRGELSKNNDIVFDKPAGEYLVIFDAGGYHIVEIPGSQIFK